MLKIILMARLFLYFLARQACVRAGNQKHNRAIGHSMPFSLQMHPTLACTGGPHLVRFLGPGKNLTMQNSYKWVLNSQFPLV